MPEDEESLNKAIGAFIAGESACCAWEEEWETDEEAPYFNPDTQKVIHVTLLIAGSVAASRKETILLNRANVAILGHVNHAACPAYRRAGTSGSLGPQSELRRLPNGWKRLAQKHERP